MIRKTRTRVSLSLLLGLAIPCLGIAANTAFVCGGSETDVQGPPLTDDITIPPSETCVLSGSMYTPKNMCGRLCGQTCGNVELIPGGDDYYYGMVAHKNADGDKCPAVFCRCDNYNHEDETGTPCEVKAIPTNTCSYIYLNDPGDPSITGWKVSQGVSCYVPIDEPYDCKDHTEAP